MTTAMYLKFGSKYEIQKSMHFVELSLKKLYTQSQSSRRRQEFRGKFCPRMLKMSLYVFFLCKTEFYTDNLDVSEIPIAIRSIIFHGVLEKDHNLLIQRQLCHPSFLALK